MGFFIDERGDVERQVAKWICHAIARGVWREGEALPSPDDLARELILNPNPIRKAVESLTRSGVIVHDARGATLRGESAEKARAWLIETAKQEMNALMELLTSAGIESGRASEVLSAELKELEKNP